MLVYGKNVAREVLKKKEIVKKIYISDDFDNNEIKSMVLKSGKTIITKSKKELDKLIDAISGGIVIDIEEIYFKFLEDIIEDDSASFIVMLDHIEDPHNFGAIIRTCECAGVDYIIIPNKGNVSVNATVMKTSSGALVNMPICKVANLNNTIKKLKNYGYWIIGSDADGMDYTKLDYKGKVVLIIGSEGKGLKQIVRSSCDFIASIPIKGNVNSLNASVATGVLIYEIVKSRE